MADYRCYPLTPAGMISGPGQIADCIDDTVAIAKARALLPMQAFEVWEGARMVFTMRRLVQEHAAI